MTWEKDRREAFPGRLNESIEINILCATFLTVSNGKDSKGE